MSSDGFDISELTNFEKQLLSMANEKLPKESRSFLQKEGNKLKTVTKNNAKKVKKKTGNYHKSIKRGKVYNYNGSLSIRCYSSDPKAHLIEKGHRIITKDGREVGFKDGEHVFEEAEKTFESTYYGDTENFIDSVISKL